MDELQNFTLGDFDLSAALGISPEPEAEAAPSPAQIDQGPIKVSHRMGARQLWRKAASEAALEKAID